MDLNDFGVILTSFMIERKMFAVVFLGSLCTGHSIEQQQQRQTVLEQMAALAQATDGLQAGHILKSPDTYDRNDEL